MARLKREWVKGEFSTNSIEGFWSIFKRGIVGIYPVYHQNMYTAIATSLQAATTTVKLQTSTASHCVFLTLVKHDLHTTS